MVFYHWDGIYRSEEEDSLYIGSERLSCGDITSNHFESHIRRMGGCGPSPI